MKVNVVLLNGNLAPEIQKKLARTTDANPGSDGRMRKQKLIVADISFRNGNKPITRMVYLERSVLLLLHRLK